VDRGGDALLLVGIALALVGLGFKVSAVPFHVWTPDVYQGAPSPVTAFLASTGKIAAFAALLRVLVTALGSRFDDWRPMIWALALLTLLLGSVLAVVQTDVKRMLAYSSISHAGFLLVGVEAAGHLSSSQSSRGISSMLAYLMVYAVLVIGTFAVVTVVARTGDGSTDVAAFRGLSKERPALALALTVLLLAQAGVPFTSGFVAKFGVIQAAVGVESYAIAVIAMLAAVIAAFLYLRIMISAWLTDPESGDEGREPVAVPVSVGVALVLAVGFTLVVGFFPSWIIDATRDAVTLALR
jgi:NADH-quinone oxidoreductase subunit N